MTENEFDTHADTFRDKRVWVKMINGLKDTIYGIKFNEFYL